jgi:hypothetical protein
MSFRSSFNGSSVSWKRISGPWISDVAVDFMLTYLGGSVLDS